MRRTIDGEIAADPAPDCRLHLRSDPKAIVRDIDARNRRTTSVTQPGRERPPNRPWGEGPGSGGGVAHVPAALRGAVSGGKTRRHTVDRSTRLSLRKFSRRIRLRARAALCESARSLRCGNRYFPPGGGRWTPWRHLPLLLPLVVVSGTSRSPQVDGSGSRLDTVRR